MRGGRSQERVQYHDEDRALVEKKALWSVFKSESKGLILVCSVLNLQLFAPVQKYIKYPGNKANFSGYKLDGIDSFL